MGQCVRPWHRPGPSALLVVGMDAWARGLRPPARAVYRDDGPVGDRRRLCWAEDHRGTVDQALRRHGNPCLAAARQQVPADHRAAQPEHGNPRREPAVPAARHGPGAGGLVDPHQPDLPRGAAGTDDRAPGAWAEGRLLAGHVSFTGIVLAGSRPGRDAFAQSFGTNLKGLIPIGGEPMVRRPVRALLESRQIGKVLILSQAPDRIAAVVAKNRRVEFRESLGTIAGTVQQLLDDASIEWPLLVTTADHALLDPETIDEFLGQSMGSDVAIGVVERSNLMRRLPETERTWLKFRGGAYTGANLFALKSPAVRPAIELWRSVEQDRKKAWRVISLLGPVVLLCAALRLVSLDEVLAQLGGRMGLKLKAVRLSNPLAGVDVDKAAEHALVEAILSGRAGPISPATTWTERSRAARLTRR